MTGPDADARSYAPPPPTRRFAVGGVLAVGLLVVATATVIGVRTVRLHHAAQARAAAASRGRPVIVVRLDRTAAPPALRLPGALRGYVETPVYSKLSGYVKAIHVDRGDAVHAGQLLVEIEAPEVDQQVRNARASFDVKRITDERYQALRKTGVVSMQEADQTHADMLQAKASLEQLEAMQGYERITADWDGMVTTRAADPGALVSPATGGGQNPVAPILTLATLRPLRVYVDVPQSAATLVKDGDRAVVTVREYAGREFVGSVTRHPQALTPATRTMLVEVDLPNDDGALLPGMYAEVTVHTSGGGGVPRIPDDALVFRDGKTYAPVVEDDHLHLVPITLGRDDGRSSEVLSGLTGSERVATNVGQSGRDGELVQPREKPAEEPPPPADAHG